MRRLVIVLACAVAGCTVANPLYSGGTLDGGVGGVGSGGGGNQGPGDGGLPDLAAGGGHGPDDAGAGPPDLAHSSPPDLSHPGECGPWERSCVDSPTPASEACVDNSYTTDRRCPYGSLSRTGAACADGYCQPPDDGDECTRESDCSNFGGGAFRFSCQPFISDPATSAAGWWCAVAVTTAQGGAGTACSGPGDCRNDLCGSNGTCFYACAGNSDCPSSRLHCAAVSLEVEGVELGARSCIP